MCLPDESKGLTNTSAPKKYFKMRFIIPYKSTIFTSIPFNMSPLIPLVSSHYLPCIDYMQVLLSADTILIEKHDLFMKGSYRNRMHIASSSGVQRLSIPLKKGKNQNALMKDVEISYTENWQRIHWQALCTCYNN